MYFDTHAHLDDERFDDDRDALIASFAEHGVSLVLNASSDMNSARQTVRLCEKYPFIYGAVGVHPHSASEMTDGDFDELHTLVTQTRIQAVGEIGLDYHYDFSPRDIQKRRFYDQLVFASERNLPVVVHDREAHQDCLDILRGFPCLNVVYHCYSGSVEYAEILIRMGFYLSFGGAITFKNARHAHNVIRHIPIDRLLIETDSPYLTPVPFRGKRNSPAFVPYVAQKIAELMEMPKEEIARITAENGKRVFRISD